MKFGSEGGEQRREKRNGIRGCDALPERRFKYHPVSATVFSNEAVVEGTRRIFYTVNIQREYKDATGKRAYSSSFGEGDLPKVSLAAGRAYEYILLMKQEQKTR